jgi:hypothetical protein
MNALKCRTLTAEYMSCLSVWSNTLAGYRCLEKGKSRGNGYFNFQIHRRRKFCGGGGEVNACKQLRTKRTWIFWALLKLAAIALSLTPLCKPLTFLEVTHLLILYSDFHTHTFHWTLCQLRLIRQVQSLSPYPLRLTGAISPKRTLVIFGITFRAIFPDFPAQLTPVLILNAQ